MGPRELGAAVAAQQKDAVELRRRPEMPEEEEGRFVGPVQVVQDHHNGCVSSGRPEKSDHGTEGQVSLHVWLRRRRVRTVRDATAEYGNESHELATVGLDMFLQHPVGCVGHVVGERFHKGSVGKTQDFVTPPVQNEASPAKDVAAPPLR